MAAVSRKYVLDASALVELLLRDRYARAAEGLLRAYGSKEGIELITAAHGPIEVTNALRRLVRERAITLDDGTACLVWLSRLRLTLDPPTPRLGRVWQLRDRMSAYDAAYVAAADAHQAPLLTVDKALIKAGEKAGSRVVHLGKLTKAL